MNRRLFGLQSALLGVLLLGSCKKDPTASGVGKPAGLSLEFTARTMAVADSVHTFAVVRDQVGTPLDIPVTLATGCTPGIVSVRTVSDAPQLRTGFFVKAIGYGTSCVIATANGFTDSMAVTTVPKTLVVNAGPDTLTSGQVGVYTYQYRDAANAVMVGLPAPTFSSGDTTIVKIGASLGQAAGRAPGVTTLTVSGTAGLSTTKTVVVVPLAFNGTASSPVDPGAILTIRRNVANPVFDANTATSAGTVITATRTADSIQVRVADLASAGAKTFSLTGVGPNDLAYDGGTYTVNTPAAFTGTFNPASPHPSQTVTVIRNPADPAFASTMKVFRGTSVGGLAAVTPVSGSITADSFRLSTADLDRGGSYTLQITELGAANAARRGTYTLAVGTYTGTISPASGAPASSFVLHRGGGDPLFDADTRVFLGGIRTFINSFSTDTAVVVVPPVETTDPVDIRISRADAGQLAVDALGAFTSTTSSPLDANDHANDFFTGATPLTTNGNHYITLSGGCDGGVATKGADDCDDLFKIVNNSGGTLNVTVTMSWFTNADVDILWCNADCSGFVGNFNGATGANPETSTVAIPNGATWNLWLNLFDPGTAGPSVVRVNVTGLP
jgi:hypothetical protein